MWRTEDLANVAKDRIAELAANHDFPQVKVTAALFADVFKALIADIVEGVEVANARRELHAARARQVVDLIKTAGVNDGVSKDVAKIFGGKIMSKAQEAASEQEETLSVEPATGEQGADDQSMDLAEAASSHSESTDDDISDEKATETKEQAPGSSSAVSSLTLWAGKFEALIKKVHEM